MQACRRLVVINLGRQLLKSKNSAELIKPQVLCLQRDLRTETPLWSIASVLAEYESEEEEPQKPSIKDVYKVNEQTVCVTFNDGSKCHFKNIWLRDSCSCPECVHPLTKHKIVNSAHIDTKIQPLSWSVDDSNKLEVNWPQNGKQPMHSSAYSAEWLHQFIKVFEQSAPGEIQDEVYCTKKTSTILWNREEIEENLPEVEYTQFMQERSGLKKVVKNVSKFGLAIIKGVPLNDDEIVKVVKRMAYVRETNFGLTFNVKVDPDPKTHPAYTSQRFGHHTDLPYRERAPGVQLLHCLKASYPKNGCEDKAEGMSFFSDGFYAAQWLKFNYPEQFHLLTNTPVTFAFYDSQKGGWYRETRPVIGLDAYGKLKDIHLSPISMRPPLVPLKQVEKFYQALRTFTKKVEEEKSQLSFNMVPGDLVIFNNRRLLHGRTEFPGIKEERHLKGCYMDLDEIYSLYEKMRIEDETSM